MKKRTARYAKMNRPAENGNENHKKMFISVVIPVYNTGKYLKKCIESVLNQTYRDFEIILVNDASTDDSRNICRRYAQEYDYIKLIDKTCNEGVDRARFSALDMIRQDGGGNL